MSLTVLICTHPGREHLLARLLAELNSQLGGREHLVKIKVNSEPRNMTTGTKRNILKDSVDTAYWCFIDDDDLVVNTYVRDMLYAIDQGPDVITFRGWMTTDGDHRKSFVIRLHERYEERNNVYYRFPNHLCAFRTDLVRHIRFPDLWQQEDYAFAKQIHDRRILQREHHIDKEIYWYDYRSNKQPNHNIRRTIK